MIRRHEFNSEWWGEDVGIVSDRAFFELSASVRREALRKFAWVEYVQTISELPPRHLLAESGFFYIDTQIRFRLDMRKLELSQYARELEVKSAAESSFEIHPTNIRSFLHERFYEVPGTTELRLSARYSLWASRLISQNRATCLLLSLNDEIQGWFLAQPENNGLELTLAMLSAGATVSGYDLYARATARFAELGHQLGFASFSAHNSNVLNIYSQLGARFLAPRECWVWIPNQNRIV